MFSHSTTSYVCEHQPLPYLQGSPPLELHVSPTTKCSCSDVDNPCIKLGGGGNIRMDWQSQNLTYSSWHFPSLNAKIQGVLISVPQKYTYTFKHCILYNIYRSDSESDPIICDIYDNECTVSSKTNIIKKYMSLKYLIKHSSQELMERGIWRKYQEAPNAFDPRCSLFMLWISVAVISNFFLLFSSFFLQLLRNFPWRHNGQPTLTNFIKEGLGRGGSAVAFTINCQSYKFRATLIIFVY